MVQPWLPGVEASGAQVQLGVPGAMKGSEGFSRKPFPQRLDGGVAGRTHWISCRRIADSLGPSFVKIAVAEGGVQRVGPHAKREARGFAGVAKHNRGDSTRAKPFNDANVAGELLLDREDR